MHFAINRFVCLPSTAIHIEIVMREWQNNLLEVSIYLQSKAWLKRFESFRIVLESGLLNCTCTESPSRNSPGRCKWIRVKKTPKTKDENQSYCDICIHYYIVIGILSWCYTRCESGFDWKQLWFYRICGHRVWVHCITCGVVNWLTFAFAYYSDVYEDG